MHSPSSTDESLFKQRVIQIIQTIPYGHVMSYGQVAACAGVARAARQVGWILNKTNEKKVPWWRVINNTGRITIKGSVYSPQMQADMLRAEGITFVDDLQVHIESHRYHPSKQQLQHWMLPELYIQMLLDKFT